MTNYCRNWNAKGLHKLDRRTKAAGGELCFDCATGEPTWEPASVGCHWKRGAFTISTVSQGKRHGYSLYGPHQHRLGAFLTWEECIRRLDIAEANEATVRGGA